MFMLCARCLIIKLHIFCEQVEHNAKIHKVMPGLKFLNVCLLGQSLKRPDESK
jgi:hypothetical protein